MKKKKTGFLRVETGFGYYHMHEVSISFENYSKKKRKNI